MSVLSPKFAMLSNEGQNPHTCLVGCSDSRAVRLASSRARPAVPAPSTIESIRRHRTAE